MKYLSKKEKKILKISLISCLTTIVLFFLLSTLTDCNPIFGGVLYSGDLPNQYLSFFQYYRHLMLGNWSSAGFSFLRSEEHTSELQSRFDLVCRLLLEKKKR